MDERFASDVLIHRPEATTNNLVQIKMNYKLVLSRGGIQTRIHDIIAAGDRVVVRLSHKRAFVEGQMMWSPSGPDRR